jgi:hypothetical protein
MNARHIIPFLLDVLQYPLGLLAVGACIFLFVRSRHPGWLLLSAIFLEPFFWLIYGMAQGLPFPLRYRQAFYDDAGILHESISYNVPFFLIVAVVGLLWIAYVYRNIRAARRGQR